MARAGDYIVLVEGAVHARLYNAGDLATVTAGVESWRGWTEPDEYGDVGFAQDARVEIVPM